MSLSFSRAQGNGSTARRTWSRLRQPRAVHRVGHQWSYYSVASRAQKLESVAVCADEDVGYGRECHHWSLCLSTTWSPRRSDAKAGVRSIVGHTGGAKSQDGKIDETCMAKTGQKTPKSH
ncbi:hypothetical protein O1611_g8347 [Lasiodiplodia mahajangana]|uniref:Uncharacterized protein n=1 Tax=Lasiodiplodia mahajangana TaxID=1108764 RepID=A0ACC2JDC1_9PEZI|nr:hypothetical protein O1611_g8347 [Lasiodiplodia mahajangana]